MTQNNSSATVGPRAYQSNHALANMDNSQDSFRLWLLRFLKGEKKPKFKRPIQTKKKSLKDTLTSLLVFRIRLMPMVIFCAVMVLGVRFTTFVSHVDSYGLMKKAYAADTVKDTRQLPLSHLDKLPESKSSQDLKALSEFDVFNMTADQYRALRGVVDRSDALSDREKSLSEKEQILKALLKKMDEKAAQLERSKKELQALVNQIDEEENANTRRLVKMTEGMKPAQAAAVLEDVEFGILLEIMEKLKEKKAAAILAAMDAKKAGYLMTAMSKRRKVFKKDNPGKSVMKG